MIVLFTDFGLAGPYTGQMKAVLRRLAPGIPVIDLFADAPSRNPRASAYLLAAYAAWFPAGTVFLCRRRSRRRRRPRAARWSRPTGAAMSAPRTAFSSWSSAAPPTRGSPRSPGGRPGFRRAFTAATFSRRSPPCWRAAIGRERAAPGRFRPPPRLARRSRRDRLYRPLRQRADRPARRDHPRRRRPPRRRPLHPARRDLLRRPRRRGLLVREFQRPRRDRGQSRPRRRDAGGGDGSKDSCQSSVIRCQWRPQLTTDH